MRPGCVSCPEALGLGERNQPALPLGLSSPENASCCGQLLLSSLEKGAVGHQAYQPELKFPNPSSPDHQSQQVLNPGDAEWSSTQPQAPNPLPPGQARPSAFPASTFFTSPFPLSYLSDPHHKQLPKTASEVHSFV